MLGLGWPEVLVILLVIVVIFGPKKLPEIGSSLGKTLRGFKAGIKGTEDDSDYTKSE
ncbi:MAG: twin-arginine translocase TatA/TatE family subunit [Microcystaceae cyanobacterium]